MKRYFLLVFKANQMTYNAYRHQYHSISEHQSWLPLLTNNCFVPLPTFLIMRTIDSYYTLLNHTSGGIPLQYHSNENNIYSKLLSQDSLILSTQTIVYTVLGML